MLLDKLQSIYERFQYLEERMSDPSVVNNMDDYSKISKEYKDLKEIVEVYLVYKKKTTEFEQAKAMLSDVDLMEIAQMEYDQVKPELEALEEDLKVLLIPRDPEDSKDVIFEIRSGTGGDEASIFAGDLYRMYTRYFDTHGLKYEVLDVNEGNVGGYNKIVLEVTGENVYGKLKFESGAHRVQRVPKTEAQGRVHTSASTVVVMPKMELEEVNINKADLRVDTFRSSGAGGQHVNKTESGVRFTHIPSGIVAESTDSRSQHKNREIAFNRLLQKMQEANVMRYETEVASQRRSLVGSGDRSDKIRTYNYPQNRITDHRINLTLYNLSDIVNGDLDEIIESLQVADNAEKLKGEIE
ncbi:MAG: peptide chain release factor 1 [Saprospiraceae bacterium]|nr:peptide chain release factor 1 [Saprospiraceae bacterium]MBK8451013.1 peptide chain release factor 1 [Saprospiraceae bacterium]MBK8485741.1 peptide chain release factor 1 [Saprospiraceae bacterium]MBK9222967.1 peptide chain release factor 1 [Saprospiraceae bacterium]MBK9723103.1 peptide chain release factor 1 [Saprospiraceae bacterium]